MAVLFLCDEWVDFMVQQLSRTFTGQPRITASLCQIVYNAPDGDLHWMLLKLYRGRFVSYTVGTRLPPKADLTAGADYRKYQEIITAGESKKARLLSGEFQLGGNVLKAAGLISCYDLLEQAQRSIQTQFIEKSPLCWEK